MAASACLKQLHRMLKAKEGPAHMLMDRFLRSRSCMRLALMRWLFSVLKWGASALISSAMAAESALHSRAVRSTATRVAEIASALRAMTALRACVAACRAVSFACRSATTCNTAACVMVALESMCSCRHVHWLQVHGRMVASSAVHSWPGSKQSSTCARVSVALV